MDTITTEELGQGVRAHVRGLLITFKTADDLHGEAIAKLRAEGHRIISGGQAGPYNAGGECRWHLADYATGDPLVSLLGTLEDYEQACRQADPDGTWRHIDAVPYPDTDLPPAGIPESLGKALAEWADQADPADLIHVTGWPAEKVARLLDQPHSR